MYCYCSICRKTAGAGGFAINLHADADSLELKGEEAITVYRAYLDHPQRSRRSEGERRFCKHCGSMLWVWDPAWPGPIITSPVCRVAAQNPAKQDARREV